MAGYRFILCTCRAHPSNSVEVLGLCRQSFHWLASGVGRWHRALFGSPGGSIGVQAQILSSRLPFPSSYASCLTETWALS